MSKEVDKKLRNRSYTLFLTPERHIKLIEDQSLVSRSGKQSMNIRGGTAYFTHMWNIKQKLANGLTNKNRKQNGGYQRARGVGGG